MESELKILKKIFEKEDEANVKLISNYLGFSQDYIRYLCQRLVEKDLLIPRERDWYQISQKGKRELKSRGLIEVKKGKIKKGPKKLVPPLLKLREFPRKTNPRPNVLGRGKLAPNFSALKEKKLKLSKGIERAVFSLKKLIS